MVAINNASSELQWQIIRKNSAFLRRQRGINKHFSREKFNLKSVNSPWYNGLINAQAFDIRLDSKKNELVVSIKKKRAIQTPAKATVATNLKNSVRAVDSVKKILDDYCHCFRGVAKRRASQLIRSTKKARKTTRQAKTE